MKIDRVIVSTNDNQEYQSYWPYFAEICTHFEVAPILIWVSNSSQPYPFPSQYGSIIQVPQTPILSSSYQATIVRFLAFASFSDISSLSDIDILFTNKKYFETFEKYANTDLVVWSAQDPNIYLYEQNVYKDKLRAPQIIVQGFTGPGEPLRQALLSNGIHVTKTTFWSEDIEKQILNMPNLNNSYPEAFEFKLGSDQLWISQVLHHHMMITETTNDWKIKQLERVGIENGVFGGPLWWPDWENMLKIRKDVENSEKAIDEYSLLSYPALHWYRDGTKIATKKLVKAILLQEKLR